MTGAGDGMIRVLPADDQALIRSGIRSLLDAEDDIEVVAEAADGEQAVTLAAAHRPDIALVDIQMPVLDGIEATRQIVADPRLAGVRVVILTNFGLDERIFRALRAGASGFLLKDIQPAELLQALRVAMGGDALLSRLGGGARDPRSGGRAVRRARRRRPDLRPGAAGAGPA
jgi:DNA-binding NarL/FixJ family response regulator